MRVILVADQFPVLVNSSRAIKNPIIADGEMFMEFYRELDKICTKVAMNCLETIRSWSTSDR